MVVVDSWRCVCKRKCATLCVQNKWWQQQWTGGEEKHSNGNWSFGIFALYCWCQPHELCKSETYESMGVLAGGGSSVQVVRKNVRMEKIFWYLGSILSLNLVNVNLKNSANPSYMNQWECKWWCQLRLYRWRRSAAAVARQRGGGHHLLVSTSC